ncbi:zinc-ribbon domain-containing protein [Pediococcus ethanolidurans]|uniref:zinc ribbon domain-containing protein n=1 Tax=Pediococcus ethanolidurans TaxID=319653 RepID=UPI002955CC2C|nr:zinc ribbon domain-containing protein [Pediococcus ethanolidurans]MDV7720050.1 zinc-ribbon domain-containing protein [Pediococcus ethanolidurans]
MEKFFCPNCGTELSKHTAFCKNCGFDLASYWKKYNISQNLESNTQDNPDSVQFDTISKSDNVSFKKHLTRAQSSKKFLSNNKPPQKNNKKWLIVSISLLLIIVVLLIVLVMMFLGDSKKSQKSETSSVSSSISKVSHKKKTKESKKSSSSISSSKYSLVANELTGPQTAAAIAYYATEMGDWTFDSADQEGLSVEIEPLTKTDKLAFPAENNVKYDVSIPNTGSGGESMYTLDGSSVYIYEIIGAKTDKDYVEDDGTYEPREQTSLNAIVKYINDENAAKKVNDIAKITTVKDNS